MMTREEYYAQIKEMYAQKYESPSMKAWRSGSDHFERSGDDRWFSEEDRRFREYLMSRNDDDDETWTWTETDLSLDDETDFLEEKSTSQFQVPIDNSEIVRSIEPERVDLELERLEVVTDKKEPMEVDISEVEHKTESEGRAEEPPKSAADEVHVQSIELVVRDQAQEARSDVVSSLGVNVTRVGAIQSQPCISGRANRVWKPGGLLCVPNKKFEAELEIYDCETKKHMLLLMKLANRVWECGELLATHVYCKWLVNCYKSDRVLKCYFLSEIPFVEFIEFKACKKELSVAGLRQLSLASMTFELRNVEDGVKKDKNRFSGDVGAKILMALEGLHLLQDVFEMVKELLLKTSLVIQSLVSQEPAISANQEPANSATQEPTIFQPTLRFLMNTRQSCLSLRANRVWDPGGSNSETD